MTGENRKQNLQDELARGAECFRAAEALLALGLVADAVSRTYYGVFHVLRALLFSQGVEPKSHQGAIHLFNVELVRKGLMAPECNRLLGSLQRTRELADCAAAVVFSSESASADLVEARAFEANARELLAKAGWTT